MPINSTIQMKWTNSRQNYQYRINIPNIPHIHSWKSLVSSINGIGKTGCPHVEEETVSLFTLYIKINSVRIKDLNIRYETLYYQKKI